ncbi:hypothetical protein LTR85_011588 [Meristemomyces frigidus]|nr:hypothetical protein LTR85_011588 [Meristemomyces frigidus]
MSRADIQRRYNKTLLSGAPTSVSIADKTRRDNSSAAQVQNMQLRLERQLQQGLITEDAFQDAFCASEHAIHEKTDKEIKRLVGEDPDLSHNIWVGTLELGSSLAAMLGLLEVGSAQGSAIGPKRRSEKAVEDWQAEEERLGATGA